MVKISADVNKTVIKADLILNSVKNTNAAEEIALNESRENK